MARTSPGALPRREHRLDAEIGQRYGPGRIPAEVSQAWRPYCTWAAVHMRGLHEQSWARSAGR